MSREDHPNMVDLWWKVLEAAIKDAVYTDEWIFSDSVEVGSFRWVCEWLETDPDYWRRKVDEARRMKR